MKRSDGSIWRQRKCQPTQFGYERVNVSVEFYDDEPGPTYVKVKKVRADTARALRALFSLGACRESLCRLLVTVQSRNLVNLYRLTTAQERTWLRLNTRQHLPKWDRENLYSSAQAWLSVLEEAARG